MSRSPFRAGLDAVGVGEGTRLLDVGCGAGRALRVAAARGADVTGLDAAAGLLECARHRVPGAEVIQGEIQSLPFPDAAFDAMTGFNSFQYAGRPDRGAARGQAGNHARRPDPRPRLEPGRDVRLAPHLQSLGALTPPPPTGAPGPFALCGRDALREFFTSAELRVADIADVMCTFAYPDTSTAIAALSSAGPVVRVAEHAGDEAVRGEIEAFLAQYIRPDGTYAIRNPFRYAVSTPIP